MVNKNTCFSINDLPSPPINKVGWPWTEQSQLLPEYMPDGSEWPRISIVTASYNYDRFLEETIRSVLLQGYPNLEYIIIDGDSKDTSPEIIKKYASFLTYWVSEPDQGQTDAINKGYRKCTGDIFSWLNSDDIYKRNTLLEVAGYYRKGYEFIAGSCKNFYFETNTEEVINSSQWTFSRYLRFWSYPPKTFLPQPSVFLSKRITDKCFPLDIGLYCAMDQQYFLRALRQNPKRVYVERIWVEMKYHGDNKTGSNYPVFDELCQISLLESVYLPFLSRIYFRFDLTNYIKLKSLLDSERRLSLTDLVGLVLISPTILKLLLFWKVIWKVIFRQPFH
jgi:glycosyltransferase involved in cell wall biosynthesis